MIRRILIAILILSVGVSTEAKDTAARTLLDSSYDTCTKTFAYIANTTTVRKAINRIVHGPPNLKTDLYTIRVAGQNSISTQAIKALVSETSSNLDFALRRMRELGLAPKGRITVIAEAQPRTVSIETIKNGTSSFWNPNAVIGPFAMSGASSEIGLRKRLGLYQSYKLVDKTVVLAHIMEIPTFGNRQIAAHEISHLSENPLENSFIWQEGRADAVANLVTGKSEIRLLPHDDVPTDLEVPAPSVVVKIRDLAAPKISHRKMLIGQEDHFHENSEIVSSLLFELRNSLGETTSTDLIKWMDRNPDQTDKYVSPLVIGNVVAEVGRIMARMRAWAKTQPAETQVVLEKLITDRGF